MGRPRKAKPLNPAEELRRQRARANKDKWEVPFFRLFTAQHPDLPVPIRDYNFAASLGRNFKADFCWPGEEGSKVRLIVELDGGGARSRHATVTGYAADCDKINCAAMLHYRVMRFNILHLKRMAEVVDFVAKVIRGLPLARIR